MNLNQITLDKIEQLGPKDAALYFGKTEPTIRNWIRAKQVPAFAAQKVFDELPSGGQVVGIAGHFDDPNGPKTAAGITSEPLVEHIPINQRVAMLELRVANLEFKSSTSVAPSVVPPQKQPHWSSAHEFNRR